MWGGCIRDSRTSEHEWVGGSEERGSEGSEESGFNCEAAHENLRIVQKYRVKLLELGLAEFRKKSRG